jgi:hypothetical protein
MGIVGCGSSPPKDLQQSDNEEEKVGNKTSPSRWMRSKLPLLVSAFSSYFHGRSAPQWLGLLCGH